MLSLDNHSLDHFQSYPLTPPQSPTLCSLPQDASFAQATEFARGVLGHPRDQKESSKGMPEVQAQEMQSTYLLSMIWRPVLMSTSAKDQNRAPVPCVRFEQFRRAETALFLPQFRLSLRCFTDPVVSVTARLHALVANPTTRYVRMESIRSPIRQSFDQGELPFRVYRLRLSQLTFAHHLQLCSNARASACATHRRSSRALSPHTRRWRMDRASPGN